MTVRVEFRGVGKRYPDGWALRECDLTVEASTITALVGANGAGKSTLMASAAGLVSVTTGEILVDGEAIGAMPDARLGYLAQDKPMYRRWRVCDMLAQTRDLNSRWDARHALRLVDEAGLSPTAKVGRMSAGQRTRLALALVLGRRPGVVLLDEPLADLDPLARLQVQQMLMTEVATTGTTVLLSSHSLDEIRDTCDDLALLQDGRITLHGRVDMLEERHRLLTGPPSDPLDWLPSHDIVEVRSTARQTTVLVCAPPPVLPTGWTDGPAGLEEIVLARLRKGTALSNHQDGAA